MKRGFQWLLAMAMCCSALWAGAADETETDWRAPLTEANAVYDDFESTANNGHDYKWGWSNGASAVAMPTGPYGSKKGLLTASASNAKPGVQNLPFVTDTTISAWTVSVYGVLSCPDDAGIWSFGKPDSTSGTAYHLGLVRRAGNVLQVVHGNPGGTKADPVPPRVLCQATVEGLDTDSRLYTVVSDGTAVRLLVDGEEVARATPENADDLKAYASWQVGSFTGSEPTYAGLVFADGMLLDAVALQGRALADAEILGLAEHVFPRVGGVNVAVPEVALPESWKADAPAFARVRKDGLDASGYRRLRKPNGADDWYASALTEAEGGNITGPCPNNGKPSALFALGGAADSLIGGAYATSTRTYSGDTLVVVGGTQTSLVVGGVNSYGTKWQSPVTTTFKGASSVVVREILPAGGTVVGGSCSTSSSDGGIVVHEGASSVRVEIPEAEGTFGATVLGGSWDNRQTNANSKATGDASVTIDAPNVTFDGKIAAGNGANMTQVSGSATLILRAGIFTGTLLPEDGPKGAALPSTLAIEGDIDLSRATLGTFDTLTVAGKLALGERRLTATALAAPTAAATLAITLTEAERAAGADITLCKVAFDTLPDALAVDVAEAPEGWEARVTPDRRLVYGPVPGNHVWDGGDTAWDEAFPGWEAGEGATFEAPAENATRTVTLGADVAAERVILRGSNRLVGSGTLVADGVTLEDGATLALPRETAEGFGWVRLTLGKNQDGSTTQAALAEFVLTQGGTPVPWPLGTTIARGDGSVPAWNNNEQLNALIDGVHAGSALPAVNPADGSEKTYATAGNQGNNKWYVTKDNNNAVAVIALGEPVKADGYTFWTSDTPSRTPAEWTLEVSDDGETWRPFDARSGVSGFAKHTAYDYLARGEARVETDALILGEGVTLDLSQGFAPLVADEVRGVGGTVLLPAEGVPSRVPFLVTPTAGLTFAIKDDPETYYRVVYADGAYCVEPYTLTMPLSATVAKAAAWTELPWKDAAGYDVPVRFWADETFVPDVTLTFTAKATVTFDTRTVGDVTISPTSTAVGSLAQKGAKLSLNTLTVGHDALVGTVFAKRVVIAKDVRFTADIGGDAGDTVWECPIEGEGTLVKRGSKKLTLNGAVSVPRIVHGWNNQTSLVFGRDYEGELLFARSTAHDNNVLGDANAGGGGNVEIPQGVTLSLRRSDVGAEPSKSSNNAVFSGEGTLRLPEGATLALADGYLFDASKMTGPVEVAGAVAVTVADPSAGRTLLKCAAPEAGQAARLRVEGDWFARAVAGTGYVLAALPTPAEGHGLEGEALRAVCEAAAAAGLTDGFAVQATGKGTPADVLACFTGLPMEASAEANSVTVRCDFGIAALRSVEDGAAFLLKAQILEGDFAEGTEISVMGDVDLSEVSPVAPPDGEAEAPGIRWFRVPFVENLRRLAIRASR